MLWRRQCAQSLAPKASLLLGLVLNTAQWESHALNISVNVEGHQVIAQRYAAPAYVELDVNMVGN